MRMVRIPAGMPGTHRSESGYKVDTRSYDVFGHRSVNYPAGQKPKIIEKIKKSHFFILKKGEKIISKHIFLDEKHHKI